ncbi:MAG: CHASE domain-containing protein, partial [Gammaproteobacteria bacterium]|nr:CHASE domain-containing protein [Gammaproteobacteria bacterium]
PYVVIVLGILLAGSLYSLLDTSFKSSVRQRYDAAVVNHVSAIEHGIDTSLETLYHIRSGFDASSFVDRGEFRTLVSHSFERNPGIMALQWVPRVSSQERADMEAAAREEVSPDFVFGEKLSKAGKTTASQREVHFPIYYIEPQASFLPALGFDLAAMPDHLAVLMKAVNTNAPVVSSRLQSYLVEEDAYAVFVALPVYKKDMPLDSAGEREAALKGFAIMVIEIGPMIEAILKKNTSPSGLILTFADTEVRGEKAFMYRHIARDSDQDPNAGDIDDLDDGLSSTSTLAFADRHWQVTAQAANKKLYPDWDAGSFWLPLGVLLLSLGLALFLYRSAQR